MGATSAFNGVEAQLRQRAARRFALRSFVRNQRGTEAA